jgi:hypothetical protein
MEMAKEMEVREMEIGREMEMGRDMEMGGKWRLRL